MTESKSKSRKWEYVANGDDHEEPVGNGLGDVSPEAEVDLSRFSAMFDTITPSILDLDNHHPPWVYLFLERYSQTGNVMESCKYAGVSRQRIVDHKHKHPDFLKAMEDAGKDAADMLMLVAWNRAIRYSDSVLIQLLRAHFPEKFKPETQPPTLVSIQLRPYDYASSVAGIVSNEGDDGVS